MAQKENQRITLTKKLLQEGLLRLLEVKSLDKISVTELCRESGINRATFYNHYNSPQELLTSIEEKVKQELDLIIRDSKTAEEIIQNTEAVCAYFYEHARIILILHDCHADVDINQVLYEMNQNFQLFRMNSRYTKTMDQDCRNLVSVFFYTGCYNILLEWLKNDIQKTPKEIANLMIRLATENFLE